MEPIIRVERGNPTAEEVAALVGVLRRRRAGAAVSHSAESRWAESARPAARLSRPGPDAWRTSALPR